MIKIRGSGEKGVSGLNVKSKGELSRLRLYQHYLYGASLTELAGRALWIIIHTKEDYCQLVNYSNLWLLSMNHM